MKIIRLFIAFLFACILPLQSFRIEGAPKKEQNSLLQRAERIKSNKAYYTGNGYGATLNEAKRNAIEDLCGKISRSVNIVTTTRDTENSEEYDARAYISSFVTLNNTESLVISDEEGKCEVLMYVEKSQVHNDMAMRSEKIKTLVSQGCSLEKRLEIASALKYFTWAYSLAKSNANPVMLEFDGMNHDAKSWLHAHIGTMLNTLKFGLENVEERPDELDPYLVNLSVTYLDQPVADLDYSYMNNGNRIYNQHVKNGRATLAFEKLPAEHIDLSVNYRYEDEVKGFDAELEAIFAAGNKSVFSQADIQVPCKGSVPEKFQVKEQKLSKEEKKLAQQDALLAPAAVDKPRTRVETLEVPQTRGHIIIAAMEKLKKALDSRSYTSMSEMFTPEGFALFTRMMQSGTVKTAKSTPEWRVEMAGDFIVGKSIPVTIKYKGGHTVNEEIVCRFNADNKIESVAYALTKRAEDDIFRQNSWDLSARYAILQFMEDYQTAFALKRIDYIKSIFSDDAVIITGKRNPNAKTTKSDGGYFKTNEFTYNLQTKDQYIRNLTADFANKRYIKLTFEDNEICEQGGDLFNNVYWIEIRQFYSSSNYNDMGYLTLMIDMRSKDPTIKVRTWAPNKISLDELMSRYSFQ